MVSPSPTLNADLEIFTTYHTNVENRAYPQLPLGFIPSMNYFPYSKDTSVSTNYGYHNPNICTTPVS